MVNMWINVKDYLFFLVFVHACDELKIMWEFPFSMLWNILSSLEGLGDSAMNPSGSRVFLRSNSSMCLNFLCLLGSISANDILLGNHWFFNVLV